MKQKSALFILFLFIFSSFVLADGLCQTDKSIYHTGESILFSCSCSLGTEKFKAGYVVFLNQSGKVLYNVSVNSNDCALSPFGGMYTIPELGNWNGSARFSLYGNGTGLITGWTDPTDVTYDNFTVTAFSLTDCLITEVTSKTEINLGEVSSVKAKIVDPVTNQSLVKAKCSVDGYDVSSNPIIFEPYYGGSLNYRLTGSSGEVGFQRLMDEKIWEPRTSYLYEFHCYCDNSTVESSCILDSSGMLADWKDCTTKVLFTTNDDNRELTNNTAFSNMGYFLILFGIGLIFILFMHLFKDQEAASIIYGFMANAFFIINGSLLFFGLQSVFLAGVKVPFDINRMIGIICWVISIYCIWYAITLYNVNKRRKQMIYSQNREMEEFEVD